MSPVPQPRFLRSGDTALVVEFGDSVDPDISARVLSPAGLIEAEAIPGVVEMVPTFRSLMVHYEPLALPHAELERRLGPLIGALTVEERPAAAGASPRATTRTSGPDLAYVAERTGLSVAQVIERHSATEFHVYMMGFLPGFPYMGGLPAGTSSCRAARTRACTCRRARSPSP